VTIIGREDSSVFGADHREEVRLIGKPWRRVELLRNRYFYKGEQVEVTRDLTAHEQVEVTRDLTAHVGFRRLGIGFTFSIVQASYLDYGDERQ